MRKHLERYLVKEGFFPLTSNVSDISALVKFENNLLNILQIIDYKKDLYLDKEQYEEVKKSLRGAFQDKGVSEIHILSLIFSEDMERGISLGEEDPFCWQVDAETLELVIGEDKQPDFYGMKGLIQSFLDKWKEDPSQFEEEEKENEPLKPTKKQVVIAYFKQAPIISLALVIVNLILCFCCMVNPTVFYGKGCVSLTYVVAGEWYRLITAIFLHASVDHYFSNMLLLYFLGDILERRVGRVRFLLMYLLTGIFGNVLSCFHEYIIGTYYISYGASGAVFGLIGMLFYLVIRRDEKIKISMPAMLFMVAYCIYSSFVGVQVNVAAHLGGLLSGMLLMFVIGLRRKAHED